MAAKFKVGDKVRARWQSFDHQGVIKLANNKLNKREDGLEDWEYIVDFTGKSFYLAPSEKYGITSNSISFGVLVWPEMCLSDTFSMKLGTYEVEIIDRQHVKVGCTTFSRDDINKLLSLMKNPKKEDKKFVKGDTVIIDYQGLDVKAEVLSEVPIDDKGDCAYVLQVKNGSVSSSINNTPLHTSIVVIHKSFLKGVLEEVRIGKYIVSRFTENSVVVSDDEVTVTRDDINKILAEMDKKA